MALEGRNRPPGVPEAPSQLPMRPVCGLCSWPRSLQLRLGSWDSVRPHAASHLPLQPHFLEHIHTPLPTTCHMMLTFSSTDQSFLPPGLCTGCCLNRNAPHPLLDLEDARHSAVPCSSYLEALPVSAGRATCSLLGAPQAPLGILLSVQYSTYHTGLQLILLSVPQSHN